jgi:3'(2'), 5'-bisphosphate nucleotidase
MIASQPLSECDLAVWQRLPEVLGCVQAAGDAILSVYAQSSLAWEEKPDRSPLTEADRAADAVLTEGLGRIFPGWPVISEERQPPKLPGDAWARGVFLLDPLDGTREFVARNGEFTVNLAWVVDGAPVLGVVHAPTTGETYWGAAGHGAWRCTRDEPQARPIHAPGAPSGPARPIRLLASRSHGGSEQAGLLARWPAPVQVVLAGSSLKFCRIAEGAADVYPRITPTMPWDTAAGQAVLQAAGGVVWALDGLPLRVPADPHAHPNGHFVAAASAEWAQQALRAIGHTLATPQWRHEPS